MKQERDEWGMDSSLLQRITVNVPPALRDLLQNWDTCPSVIEKAISPTIPIIAGSHKICSYCQNAFTPYKHNIRMIVPIDIRIFIRLTAIAQTFAESFFLKIVHHVLLNMQANDKTNADFN
jgi:hypothetical protein